MSRRHSPLDDYDRMSDYYRDLGYVPEYEKNSNSSANEIEQSKNKLTNSIAQDSKNITEGDK